MKNKQAGGIVSFIIVAVALAGLLAGGLYLSKHQGRVARDTDTSVPQVTTKKSNEQATKEKSEDKTKDSAPQQQSSTGTAQTQQPAATPSTSGGGTPTSGSSSGRTDRVANTGPSSVPSTGPTETLAVSLALGALVFTGYRFLQSWHAFRNSALRQ